MADFGALTLTELGLDLQTKAQAGAQLQFTRVGLGDGTLPAGTTLDSLTALMHETKSYAINEIQITGDGTTKISLTISNSGLLQAMTVREIGLFATDPDLGEILYCVANAGNKPDYIPPESSGPYEQNINLITVIGTAENVTAIISSGNTDHGALTGLTDDDHPQYIPANGTRAFTGPVSGVAPTLGSHLTTRNYVDTLTSGLASALHAPVADLAAVKAIGASGRLDKMMIHIETLGLFRWDAESTAASDDSTVIRPTDIPSEASPGRWLKMLSGVDGVNNFNDLISKPYDYVVVAKEDGTLDDANITYALTNYGGKTIVFKGNFLIDSTFNVLANTKLLFAKNSVIKLKDNSNLSSTVNGNWNMMTSPIFKVFVQDNVEIDGLTIDGNRLNGNLGVATDGVKGIYAVNSKNLKITNLKITNLRSTALIIKDCPSFTLDGFHIEDVGLYTDGQIGMQSDRIGTFFDTIKLPGDPLFPTNNTIKNGVIKNIGLDCIVSAWSDVLFYNLDLSFAGQHHAAAGIYTRCPQAVANSRMYNVRIVEVDVHDNTGIGIDMGVNDGTTGQLQHDLIIDRCTAFNNDSAGIGITAWTRAKVSSCVCYNNGLTTTYEAFKSGIFIAGWDANNLCDDVYLHHNRCYGNKYGLGAYRETFIKNVKIHDNTLEGNTSPAIGTMTNNFGIDGNLVSIQRNSGYNNTLDLAASDILKPAGNYFNVRATEAGVIITGIDKGLAGDRIIIHNLGANDFTIDNNGTVALSGGADFTMTQYDLICLECVQDAPVLWKEVWRLIR